jgi:ribosome biogenesis protein SSF1/2
MNNFSSESKTQELVSRTFQNMFPSINVNKVRIADIRRVLLLNYQEEDDTIEIRHYTITFKTTGVSRGVKKILNTKNTKIPNLGRCTDIADFLQRDDEMSESEADDTTETVGLSQKLGIKVAKGLDEVGVKLVELGPRIKMQLIKIEEGLCEGEVLYHKIVDKTPEEKLYIRQQRNLKKKMKVARQREQELNVQKKRTEKEEHKQMCLKGMRRNIPDQSSQGNVDEDNDIDWYRKEVGEDPDEDAFSRKTEQPPERRKRRLTDNTSGHFPLKTLKVSKFAKVKAKAKLLKKQKELGRTGRGKMPNGKSSFNSSGNG